MLQLQYEPKTKSILFDRIMVVAPYNILFDVEATADDTIEAKVNSEYLYKDEAGPISCAEAGRHLAILGSMALANKAKTSNKNYYLAIGATFNREVAGKHVALDKNETFKLSVKVKSSNAKHGEVVGQIADSNGIALYSATISYNTLSVALFERLFKKHKYTLPLTNAVSPYENRRSFEHVHIDQDTIIGDYGVIAPNDCEGHFHEFPAFPIAIIANLFTQLGINLFLDQFKGFEKAFYTNASLTASRLPFHGEHIIFKGAAKSKSENSMIFHVEALIDGKVVAEGLGEVKGLTEQ